VEAAIEVVDLRKRYGDVVAVAGISFDVQRGTIFGLLGRNGAGKTTTLESCIGLVKPTSGTVRVLGLDPSKRGDLARLRRRFGVQLQATSLPEKAKVRELLEVYAAYYGVKSDVEASAQRVGLDGKLDRFVGKMSGGEKQRLGLALALQHDPEVIFLDEPSAGMDAYGRRVLWAEIDRLRDSGKTVVLTTHYIEEAERLCDEICVVQRGKIIARDTPAALIERFGGGASVTFSARGFRLEAPLSGAGVWTHDGDRWTVVTDREPGLLLAEIVTYANASGSVIDALDLHRPGLEDAFLAITGETIEEPADVEPAA
jgi:ABC-2 type transport system ATP-binding protein